MSRKPYKALGIDLHAATLQDRERARDTYIACHQILENAQLADPDAGPKALERMRAAAVNENLGRHIKSLNTAMDENAILLADALHGPEAERHLRRMRGEAIVTAEMLKKAGAEAVPNWVWRS
jgi:hypothetical protein